MQIFWTLLIGYILLQILWFIYKLRTMPVDWDHFYGRDQSESRRLWDEKIKQETEAAAEFWLPWEVEENEKESKHGQ